MDTVTEQPSAPTPPPPPESGGARRLTRSPNDRVVAGVAGGLGAYFDVDPVLIRIVFVIACFFGGSGFLAYLAFWALVPEAGEDTAPVQRAFDEHRGRGPAFWLGVCALALAAILSINSLGLFAEGWAWPLILIGVGVALWNVGSRDAGPSRVVEPSDRGSTQQPASQVHEPGTDVAPADGPDGVTWPVPAYTPAHAGEAGGATAAPTRAPAARERRRRERSFLGRLTVGATLITVGIGALLGATAGQLFAAALGTVGIGLLIGAFVGRSPGLVVLGLVLLPMTFFANALGDLPSPFGSAGTGERLYTVTSFEQLKDEYRLGGGQLVLDLSQLELGGREATIDVRLAAGQVRIDLPAGVGYAVDASVRAGEIRLPGNVRDSGLRIATEAGSDGARGGRIVLHVEVGLGEVVVTQPAADTGEVGA